MLLIIETTNLIPQYLGIFILMLSSFLIGYFSSLWFQKTKYKAIIKELKKKITSLKERHNKSLRNKKTKDIESLFTEIKPEIIKMVKETQEQLIEDQIPTQKEIQPSKTVPEKTRTSYITYTKTKPELNFENFGIANSNERSDLTKINGIGPYIEERLNEIGIYNFDQISKFTFEDIRAITELIDFFPGRIERDDWVGQANARKVH